MVTKERTVWRVKSGNTTRWFDGEVNARDFACNRYDTEIDGVPFIEQITLSELLHRANQLEMKSETRGISVPGDSYQQL